MRQTFLALLAALALSSCATRHAQVTTKADTTAVRESNRETQHDIAGTRKEIAGTRKELKDAHDSSAKGATSLKTADDLLTKLLRSHE